MIDRYLDPEGVIIIVLGASETFNSTTPRHSKRVGFLSLGFRAQRD